MFCKVVERQPAFSLGRIHPASGEQAAEPAVGRAIGRQEYDRRRVEGGDFGPDQKL
jgi:hypothetical protein